MPSEAMPVVEQGVGWETDGCAARERGRVPQMVRRATRTFRFPVWGKRHPAVIAQRVRFRADTLAT